MKRGILFVAVGMTVAGVASASVFTVTSSPVALQPQSLEAATIVNPVSPPELPTKPGAKKAPAPVVQKASVETQKAPVPLQVKPRSPVNLPAVDTKAAEAKPGEATAPQEAVAATSDGFNEAAVKAAIEADGSKSVRVLRKDVNGVWRATGLRGQTVVLLMVDASGSVSAE
jgi:hypothetical protein